MKITTRNASFQQWQALLTNRTKRQRSGTFLVQGVRPITLATQHGWTVETLIYSDRQALSSWARDLLDETGATPVAMAPDLVAELAEKDEAELIAVVRRPPDDLRRIRADRRLLVVVFDRPSTPGNIGTLIRSADAFGASAVIVTGHAADPYDPRSVRASTGSLFALPVIRADSHGEVLDWLATLGNLPVRVAGTDEHGPVDIADYDLTGPRVLLIGNETNGLSAGWREAADDMLRIPITGAASSLNAAAAATVVLYEAARQRSAPARNA
ncbi:TrmH family RNA methyltransferase [Actinoplanes sp. NBRC 103695]|uniref:TrmH family RNA methyltransferase n=1 Tax=Actinoplanes sp. NBRC 103695 TaxID=3032202 RepID=UPI0024A077DE|nr:TrmH family RNA methyltransferase [Actinoplanes sp. NBRC 103695]GLY94906.1 rRNA methyltransferase [Actinoplanes sp. NBRC 103695]